MNKIDKNETHLDVRGTHPAEEYLRDELGEEIKSIKVTPD